MLILFAIFCFRLKFRKIRTNVSLIIPIHSVICFNRFVGRFSVNLMRTVHILKHVHSKKIEIYETLKTAFFIKITQYISTYKSILFNKCME